MKPIQLTMSAFCSYTGRTVIPFDRLGGRGLYLITGNTGAGKTTIFDAICFALYGVASGAARNEQISGEGDEYSLLRCDSAGPDEETYVEFEFDHAGQRYRIFRSPRYARRKKRGEGTTRQEARAVLTLPGGRVMENLSQVNREIERILGINRDHFSRIAMIAQGDFAKLLLAKVEERRVILQSIFGTQYYERVQKILSERAKALEEDWKRARQAVQEGYGRLRLPPEREGEEFSGFGGEGSAARFGEWKAMAGTLIAEDRAALDRAEAENAAAMEALRALGARIGEAKQVNLGFENLDRARRELDRLARDAARIDDMQRQADRADAAARLGGDAGACDEANQALEKVLLEIGGAEADFAALREKRPALERALQDAQAQEPAARKAGYDAGSIREQLPRYRELAALDRAISDCVWRRDEAATEAERQGAEEARLKGLKDGAALERDALAGTEGALIKVQGEAESARKALEALEKLKKDVLAYEAGREALTSAQRRARETVEAAGQLADEHWRLRAAFQLGQAGLMASELEGDAPCPVCGSREHPCKAALPEDTPTQAAVEAAEAGMNRAREGADEAVRAAAVLVARREKERERLDAEWARCREDSEQPLPEWSAAEADRACRAQRERAGVLAAERTALEMQAHRFRALNEKIPGYERGIDAARGAAGEAQRQRADAAAQLEGLSGKREALARALPAATEEEAGARCEMLQQEFDRWRERHGGAEQALKDCDSGIVARSGALDALNAQRSAWERKAQDTRVALRCAVQRAGFTDEDDYRSALRAPEAVAELRDGVLEYVRAREAAGALSAQLENDLKGKARADLDALAQEERQAAMRQRERADERMNIHVRLEANGALIAELTGRAAAYEKLDARYQMVLRLSDTAGGKAVRDDAGRQSFELYVLSELFDEVILFANQRFSQMTGGQYELMREESYRNRRASFGLDLNVQDHFTGTVRPVNTLSGGESFMASLSLALGFADAISSHAGGIMLDSMFVDEGFGTLDEAALDQVMGALGRLAQGDVLIGLISHVPEMKRRIDRQIIVTKDRQGGSRAAVVV